MSPPPSKTNGISPAEGLVAVALLTLLVAFSTQGAVTTGHSITGNREGATTGTAQVVNNLLYIVDTSANCFSVKRAIRHGNGGTLPDGGLHHRQRNPAYIQGDYNTGSGHMARPLLPITRYFCPLHDSSL